VLLTQALKLFTHIFLFSLLHRACCRVTQLLHQPLHIQGVSRLVDITAGGLCDQKSSYKHVSDLGGLRSYDRLKLRIDGNGY